MAELLDDRTLREGAAKFEEREVLPSSERDIPQARERRWRMAREAMLQALQHHYGPHFPNAMMRIHAWIETEETWHKDAKYPDRWELWPHEKRPLLLYVRVTIRAEGSRQ